jgi:hypothetical protein
LAAVSPPIRWWSSNWRTWPDPGALPGLAQAGELKAAIPTWGRHLALSKDVLKRAGKKALFDLGNAEIILPAPPMPLRRCAMPGATCPN